MDGGSLKRADNSRHGKIKTGADVVSLFSVRFGAPGCDGASDVFGVFLSFSAVQTCRRFAPFSFFDLPGDAVNAFSFKSWSKA